MLSIYIYKCVFVSLFHIQYFIEYSAHFYALKMMLKYFLHAIHGR